MPAHTPPSSPYGIGKDVPMPYEEAVDTIRARLKDQGFGILMEIDVTATLREKIEVDLGHRYIILGACNPPLAHRALIAEPDLGLLLPCNVIVYETAEGCRVSAVDPEQVLGIAGNPELVEIAGEARRRLSRAIAAL